MCCLIEYGAHLTVAITVEPRYLEVPREMEKSAK